MDKYRTADTYSNLLTPAFNRCDTMRFVSILPAWKKVVIIANYQHVMRYIDYPSNRATLLMIR